MQTQHCAFLSGENYAFALPVLQGIKRFHPPVERRIEIKERVMVAFSKRAWKELLQCGRMTVCEYESSGGPPLYD
jgi:hypothetical protein